MRVYRYSEGQSIPSSADELPLKKQAIFAYLVQLMEREGYKLNAKEIEALRSVANRRMSSNFFHTLPRTQSKAERDRLGAERLKLIAIANIKIMKKRGPDALKRARR